MFGNVDDAGDLDADYLDEVNTVLAYLCSPVESHAFVFLRFQLAASSR